MEFYIGKEFKHSEYDDAYAWLQEQENPYYTIEEIDPVGDERMFVLVDETPTPEEIEQREKERIANLKCTKRVFALMLQEMGISYAQLKELIATNEQAQLEWDLSVQLERGNPLLDIFGRQLGITSEQIDILFKVANGEATVEDLQKTTNPKESEENLDNETVK